MMKTEIKDLRVKIDGLAQLTKELNPNQKEYIIKENYNVDFLNKEYKSISINNSWSVQIEKSVDSLYLAKAWLGSCLKELGENTPYSNDGNRKTIEDIEPTQNIANISQSVMVSVKLKDGRKIAAHFYELNQIEKIDYLRQEIEQVVYQVTQLGITQEKSFTKEWNIGRINSYTHLSEAKFYLGFELSRLKNGN